MGIHSFLIFLNKLYHNFVMGVLTFVCTLAIVAAAINANQWDSESRSSEEGFVARSYDKRSGDSSEESGENDGDEVGAFLAGRNKRGSCCGVSGASGSHTACKSSGKGTAIGFNKTQVLEDHNKCRTTVCPRAKNMPALVWDDQLACVAQNWALQCLKKHDKFSQRRIKGRFSARRGYTSQNLAFIWGSGLKIESMVQEWCDERKDWKYGKGQTGSGPIGHFTAMAADISTHVGC